MLAQTPIRQHGRTAQHVRPASTAGMTIAVVTTAVNTSTGAQTFSTSDMGGVTPQGAIIFITNATANATTTTDLLLSVGMTDCDASDEVGFGTNSEDGQASSDNAYRVVGAANSQIITMTETMGVTTETAAATLSSCQADGITVNWSNAPTSAYLATVVLFAGFDNWDCDAVATSGSADTAVDESLGYQADGLFMLVANIIATDVNGEDNRGGFSWGAWDGTNQVSSAWAAQNAQSTTVISGVLYNTRVGIHFLNPASSRGAYELSTHASGFTITTRDGTADGADDPYYCAWKLPSGKSAFVGTAQSPTSVGVVNITAPGFTGQAALFALTHVESLNTKETFGEGMSIGVVAGSTPTQSAILVHDQDNVTTTVSKSRIDSGNVIYLLTLDASGTELAADFDAWNANGIDLDFTTVDATNQYRYWYIVFEK